MSCLDSHSTGRVGKGERDLKKNKSWEFREPAEIITTTLQHYTDVEGLVFVCLFKKQLGRTRKWINGNDSPVIETWDGGVWDNETGGNITHWGESCLRNGFQEIIWVKEFSGREDSMI